MGVVDPLDIDLTKNKGRGQRITLSKGEDPLVDLIIGNSVNSRPGFIYVRKPTEKATYIAKRTVEPSTKFADWVETDLLQLKPKTSDGNNNVSKAGVVEIVIDHTSVDAAQGRLVAGEKDLLTREKSTDPWKLDGLDEKTEEVDPSKITPMLGTLDDLKLVGVRPKPKGLLANLTFDPELIRDRQDLLELRLDLQSKGFFLVPDRKEKTFSLYSNAGEVIAATDKGIVYTLRFGDVISGDELDIEIGANDSKKKTEEGDATGDERKKSTDAADKKESRYVFVATHFDEKFLGPPPEEPVRPEGISDDDAGGPPKINPKKKDKPKPAAGDADEQSATDKKEAPKKPQPLADDKKEGEDEKRKIRGDKGCSVASAADDELQTGGRR